MSHYASTSIGESVFIIGGYTNEEPDYYTSTIAEYKDGIWKKSGDLVQARVEHGAISFGRTMMIVGGEPSTYGES